jgi:hypothetical protein
MPRYRPAGQEFTFPCPIPELDAFAITGLASPHEDTLSPLLPLKTEIGASLAPTCQTIGWVGGEHRRVQTWSTPGETLLKVEGSRDFLIARRGAQIAWADPSQALTDLDREVLVGPALVLALALRGVWSLHASAVMIGERTLLILGETGQGKSTLAARLAQTHPRVADDILPVTSDANLTAWPRFPQLKLPMDSQPGATLPEAIPAGWICLLAPADASSPALKRITPSRAAQFLLRHTAGTRLLEPALLAQHLDFCARAAQQVPAYELTYPHRRDALPRVQALLEQVCST